MRAQRRRARDPRRPGHRVRRRVLGVRVPRGRRAERHRGRGRGRGTPVSRPVVYEGTAAPRPTRTEPTRVRAPPVPRLPRRRRAPGRARRRPRLVRPPPRAGAVPRRGLLHRRPGGRSATGSATSWRSASGAARTGPSICSRSCGPGATSSTRSPSTTAGTAAGTCSTPSCSRSRTRRGANATGTCSTPGRAAASDTTREDDVRVAVPPDGRRLPRVVDHPRANGSRSTSAWNATARPSSRPGSPCDGRRSHRRSAVGLLVRYPVLPLRGVVGDLPAARSRCGSGGSRCTATSHATTHRR